jgi:hypothetical protein
MGLLERLQISWDNSKYCAIKACSWYGVQSSRILIFSTTFIFLFIYVSGKTVHHLLNWLCGAEHYSRARHLCSHSMISWHFIEPEVSLLHSQELSTWGILSPTNPVHTAQSYICKIHIGLPSGLFPCGFPTNNLYTHLRHMPHPPYPPQLDNSNYTWWRVQIISSSLCSFLHPPRHSIPLWSKYSPQNPVLKHPLITDES